MSKPMTMIEFHNKERDRAYRKKHFAIEITESKYDPDEVRFSYTTNGSQWWTFGFLRSEIPAVIKALRKWQ